MGWLGGDAPWFGEEAPVAVDVDEAVVGHAVLFAGFEELEAVDGDAVVELVGDTFVATGEGAGFVVPCFEVV